jgi:hypothetical protein
MRLRTLVLLLCSTAVWADSVLDFQESCGHPGIYQILQCAQEFFTADGPHLTIGTIAPGAGSVAGGLMYSHIPRIDRIETSLSASLIFSTDSSWLAQAQAVIALPPVLGTRRFLSSRTPDAGFGLRSGEMQRRAQLDAKPSITFRGRMFDAKEQAFYGIGPFTALSAGAQYSLKEFDASAALNNPMTSWSSGGVNAEFLRPRILLPNSGTPIQVNYTDATAPGLEVTNNYLRLEPYLQFQFPPRRSVSISARVDYSFYHSLQTSAFSFRRLSASTTAEIPLRIPMHIGSVVNEKRNPVSSFLCETSRSGNHCSAGTLSLIGTVDATYHAVGSTSPFFLDPTLGGSDISGADTLRGFGDYRFRAPNRVLLQAEYRHPIWSVFGLLTFYDVGKVGLNPSDLNLGQLRHDLGLGVYVSVGNHEIARFYFGFGTGEPVQVHPKFGGLL